MTFSFSPVILPSLVAASEMSAICARPWLVTSMFSLRVSTQRTGRRRCLASAATASSSW
jgi:hypothetical protein